MDLIANYSRPVPLVRPQSVTFPELASAVYLTIRRNLPGFVPTVEMDYLIHDLWVIGPPDTAREGSRWLMPIVTQQLAKELARQVGAPILKGAT